MENTRRYITSNKYQTRWITIFSNLLLSICRNLPQVVIRFCLIHWREIQLTIYGGLIMGLWLFVSYNKISDFQGNMDAMLRQPIPRLFAQVLAFLVPMSEVIAALLIGIKRTRLIGFGFSSLLMIIFTLYVGLALLHVWSEELPCSCGLIIQISWKAHFILNLYLTLICLWCFLLEFWVKRKEIISGAPKRTIARIVDTIPMLNNRRN
ncbi:MauE/DoxX family redox-associated membrane protein [Sphingobacterium thalpophilum]|uniref:Methylamine utilisation protein MauE domain-containing protein n=1 Tax=Sphingobacterium thalpophilum TaxID=259 RepID=A0A4U9VPU4_9SPHI|nr:MauE/DoxX family redox-associated membrane protein [Sphingobacterium thalpophilum]VTR49340.1 Uncharacterised protein [Sphingobacterium thalpophilum]